MIYRIFDGRARASSPITLKLQVTNRAISPGDVSVVVVDDRGNISPGGYVVTFQEDGRLFLPGDMSVDFGFKLNSRRQIVVS